MKIILHYDITFNVPDDQSDEVMKSILDNAKSMSGTVDGIGRVKVTTDDGVTEFVDGYLLPQ